MKGSVISISFRTTVDILTDVMSKSATTHQCDVPSDRNVVMAMLLNLIWKVRISMREKVGLADVFSIGVIIILFAIIRAVEITYTARTDAVLLVLLGVLKSSVCKLIHKFPHLPLMLITLTSSCDSWLPPTIKITLCKTKVQRRIFRRTSIQKRRRKLRDATKENINPASIIHEFQYHDYKCEKHQGIPTGTKIGV
jgi:hypothetical protein